MAYGARQWGGGARVLVQGDILVGDYPGFSDGYGGNIWPSYANAFPGTPDTAAPKMYGGYNANYSEADTPAGYTGGYTGGYYGVESEPFYDPAYPGGYDGGYSGVGTAPVAPGTGGTVSLGPVTFAAVGSVVFPGFRSYLAPITIPAAATMDTRLTMRFAPITMTASVAMTILLGNLYTLSAEFTGKGAMQLFFPSPYRTDHSQGKTPYRLVVTDAYGNRYEELENARINSVAWKLNDMGDLDFDLPLDDPKVTACIVPQREIQVWRGGQIIWWGVLVRARGTGTTVNFQAQTLEWYFTRRVIGEVPIKNLITNGNFELEEAGWTYEYGNLEPDKSAATKLPGHVIVTSPTLSGKRAQRLTSTLTSNHKWSKKQYRYTNTTGRVVKATAVAWSYLETFNGAAAGEHGLTFVRYHISTLDPHPSLAAQGLKKVMDYKTSHISKDTQKNTWVRHEVTLEIPPDGIAYDLAARLHVPNGSIVWDEVSVTVNENLYYADTDQATIISNLVLHAQDEAKGKSNLNITPMVTPTGVKRTREYLIADRQQVSESLYEFPTLANGLDIEVWFTPTQRFLRTYYPRKETVYDVSMQPVLALGKNILDFTVDIDATLTSTTVIVQAEGEGTDREEGIAQDPSLLNGLVLENVYNATPGSSVSSLQAQADRGLARYRRPVTIPSITCHQNTEELLSKIGTGDVVPVFIKKGWVDVRGKYRVTEIVLDPNTEQITYTVTPEDTPVGIIFGSPTGAPEADGWAAPGWKYLARAQAPTYTAAGNTLPVETDVAFAARDFNDSSWSTGKAAIGWAFGSTGFQGKTVRNTELTDGTELWMRKSFLVTGDMVIYTRADNFAFLYVNGNKIVSPFIESRDASDAYVERGPFRIPQEYLDPSGVQVVALHVQDKLSGYSAGDVLVGDVKVLGTYDKYLVDTYVAPPAPYSPLGAATYITSTNGNVAADGGASYFLPSNIQEGDLLVYVASGRYNCPDPIGSGWTSRGSSTSGGTAVMKVFTKVAVSSDANSLMSFPTGNQWAIASVHVVRATGGTPTFEGIQFAAGSGTTCTAPAITPTKNSVVIESYGGSDKLNNGTMNAPATLRFSNQYTHNTLAASTRTATANVTSPARTATTDHPFNNGCSIAIGGG